MRARRKYVLMQRRFLNQPGDPAGYIASRTRVVEAVSCAGGGGGRAAVSSRTSINPLPASYKKVFSSCFCITGLILGEIFLNMKEVRK